MSAPANALKKLVALGDGLSLVESGGKLHMAVDTAEHPFFSAEGRAQAHGAGIDGYVYEQFLRSLTEPTGILAGSAVGYAADLLAAMKPRDALERMMISHALWCHGRIAKLNIALANTTRTPDMKILSGLVDRASNDFRKSMLALAEYRRPRSRRQVVIAGQINRANQQIVNNGGEEKANERRIKSVQRKTLPPAPDQPRRSRRAAAKNSRSSAVAQVNRAAKR